MKSLITRKKVVFIISIAFSIIILSIAIFTIYRINHPVYTFDEITNNLFSQYDHTDAKNTQIKEYVTRVIEEYKTYKYKLYSGSLGCTTHETIGFYSVDDELLFTITFIGNNNLVQITIDNEVKIYQGK